MAAGSTTQALVEPGSGATLLNPSGWASSGSSIPCMSAQTNQSATPIPGCPAPNDAPGSGAFRLTRYVNLAGGIGEKPTFAAADGLRVTFQESMWSGSYDGAIVFWMTDGASSFNTTFASSSAPFVGTIPNLLLAVAVDSWGLTSFHNGPDPNCHGEPGRSPASVALLGSGNASKGYCYVTGTAANAFTTHGATRAAGANTVEVDVSPSTDSDRRVIVKMNGTQIINVPFSSMTSPGTTGPSLSTVSSYRFGFAAASGQSTYQEVWNVQADTVVAHPPALSMGFSGTAIRTGNGGTVTLSPSVTAGGGLENTPLTAAATLPFGMTVASAPTGSGWNCAATVVGSQAVSCTVQASAVAPIAAGTSLPAISVPVATTTGATTGPAVVSASLSDANSPAISGSGSGVQVFAPSLSVLASSTETQYTAAGQTVPLSYLVTNTGDVALTGVAVAETMAGASAPSCPRTALAAGDAMTCTGSVVTTQAQVDALTALAGHATATGLDPASAAVTSQVSTAVSVPAHPARSLSLSSSSAATVFHVVGDVIGFSYTVTNTGAVTLSGVSVPGASCGASALAPGAQTTCTASHTVTQADLDANTLADAATASAQTPQSVSVSSAVARLTIPGDATSQISLAASETSHGFSAAGDVVELGYLVTNTGLQTLHAVSVSDDRVASPSCPFAVLAPGASETCTGSFAVSQDDVDGGDIRTTAAAAATGVSSPDVHVVVADHAGPALSLQARETSAGFSAAGDVVAFAYVLTNTGGQTLHVLAVTDDHVAAPSCPAASIAPGAAETCTGSFRVSQAEVDAGSLRTTVSAAGTGVASATVHVDVTGDSAASLALHASETSHGFAAAGDVVSFAYVLTNTGQLTLHAPAVIDDHVDAPSCPVTTIAPGASATCSGSFAVSQDDVDAGSLRTTASASATGVTSAAVHVDVEAVATSGVTLHASETTSGYAAAGDDVELAYLVSNTGTRTLHAVAVSGAGVVGIACAQTTLAAGAHETCAGSHVVSQAEVDAGSFTTSASVTALDSRGASVSDGPAHVHVTGHPSGALQLAGVASVSSYRAVGDAIGYAFQVTNTGDVTLHGVAVEGNRLDQPGACAGSVLAPGETTLCAGAHAVTQADLDGGDVSLDATAAGLSPQGGAVVSADQVVDVHGIRAGDLTLISSARGVAVKAVGAQVVFRYLVVNTGNVTLSGITVSSDHVAAAVCSESTLSPGESMMCLGTYAATQADVDRGVIVDAAAVSADDPQGAAVSSPPAIVRELTSAASRLVLRTSVRPRRAGRGLRHVEFTYAVRNAGKTTLRDVRISIRRAHPGRVTCSVRTLPPGGSAWCTNTYVIRRDDWARRRIRNFSHVVSTTGGHKRVRSTPFQLIVRLPGR